MRDYVFFGGIAWNALDGSGSEFGEPPIERLYKRRQNVAHQQFPPLSRNMALLVLPPSLAGLLLEDVLDDMLSWSDLGSRHPALRRGGPSCRPSHAASLSEHEPELRLTRTSDGVLAECALGREFTEADIR